MHVMLRAAAVCLFAFCALAQPARAEWLLEQSSHTRHEKAVSLPLALSGFLNQISRPAVSRASVSECENSVWLLILN